MTHFHTVFFFHSGERRSDLWLKSHEYTRIMKKSAEQLKRTVISCNTTLYLKRSVTVAWRSRGCTRGLLLSLSGAPHPAAAGKMGRYTTRQHLPSPATLRQKLTDCVYVYTWAAFWVSYEQRYFRNVSLFNTVCGRIDDFWLLWLLMIL